MQKYEILKHIGEGSFGQVYKAKRRSDNEIVAFKMIRKVRRNQKKKRQIYQYINMYIVIIFVHRTLVLV